MKISENMLYWLEEIHRGCAIYLSSIPAGTRRALMARALVSRDPETRKAQLTRDGRLVIAGASHFGGYRPHDFRWRRCHLLAVVIVGAAASPILRLPTSAGHRSARAPESLADERGTDTWDEGGLGSQPRAGERPALW